MSNPINKILNKFAKTDGLLKGTAILSNLITTASVAVLPGFGVSGFFIANTIQMTTSGLLEIPTGFLADRFGWRRSVNIALILKFFVTFSFLMAVMSADWNFPALIWFFFTCEALVDSFASTLLSGAYQAAYLHWYKNKIEESGENINEAPPIFLASFRHALAIRFLLPIVVGAIVLIAQVLCRNFGIITPYATSYISIACVLVLRTIVLWRVTQDLKGLENQSGKRFSKEAVQSLTLHIKSSPYFFSYILSIFVALFSSFYITAQLFRFLNETSLGAALAWASGLVIGTGLYILRTSFGVFLYPHFGQKINAKLLAAVIFIVGLLSLGAGAALELGLPKAITFVALLGLAIVNIGLADFIQRFIESHLPSIASTEMRATWLSSASSIGLLAFGILSMIITVLKIFEFATPIFCIAIFVLCVAASYLLMRTKRQQSNLKPFSNVMSNLLLRTVVVMVIIISIVDICYFAFTVSKTQIQREDEIAELATNALYEPIHQGSFIEASHRLLRMQNSKLFLCAKIKAWAFENNLCSATPSKLYESKILKKLDANSTEPSAESIGNIEFTFDRSSLFNLIFSRILQTLFFLTLLASFLYWFLNRISKNIQTELAAVIRLFEKEREQNIHAPSVSILEFEQLAKKIEELFLLKADHAKQTASIEIARQVAHDIQSPLSALKIALKENQRSGISDDSHHVIQSAVLRVQEIISDLNKNRRTDSTRLPTNVDAILEIIIREKKMQSHRDKNIEWKFDTDGNSLSFNPDLIDPSEFARMVSNLVTNGIEAISNDGYISISKVLDGTHVCISIQDNGSGIPEAIKNQLGDRGFSHGKAGGQGLGLSHAKAFLSKCGGSFMINSELGKGCTISVKIPKECFLFNS